MKPVSTAAAPTVERVMRESRETLAALRDEALAAGDRERAEWIGQKRQEIEANENDDCPAG